MKKSIVILLLLLGGVWLTLNRDTLDEKWKVVEKKLKGLMGGESKTGEEEVAGEEGTEMPDGGPDTSTTPPPVVGSTPVAPSPVLAVLPDDHFYTLERIVEVTQSGLSAIAAGTLVRKLAEVDGKYWIEDPAKGIRLHAEPWRLTRDVSAVPSVKPVVMETSPKGTPKGAPGPSAPPAAAPLSDPAAEVRAAQKEREEKRNVLKGQLLQLNSQINSVNIQLNEVLRKQASASRTNSHGITVKKLSKELQELEARRNSIQNALSLL